MKWLIVVLAVAAVTAEDTPKETKEKRGLTSSLGSLGGAELGTYASGYSLGGLGGLEHAGLELGGYDHHDHVKTHVITKPVAYSIPKPVPVTITKHVPYAVKVAVPYPVDRPYEVPIHKPYPVEVKRPVPVAVEKPYPVEVPVAVKVGVPAPYPVTIKKPYTVPVEVPTAYKVPVKVPVYVKDHSHHDDHYSLGESTLSLGHGLSGLSGLSGHNHGLSHGYQTHSGDHSSSYAYFEMDHGYHGHH